MRTSFIAALAVMMVCASGDFSAQTTAPSQQKPPAAAPSSKVPAGPGPAGRTSPDARPASQGLTGVWRSATYARELASDLEKSVWGPNAVSVRNVELNVRAGGTATLTVTSRVLDAKKRAVPGSTSIEVAQLVIGDAQPTVGVRTDHAVKVTSAERRYPDDPQGTWPLDGLRVQVTRIEDEPGLIDLRFDTPEGRGSFWESLRRQGAARGAGTAK